MALLTLTGGRAQALDYVDDPNGRRFNSAGDFAKVDRAVQAALSYCVDDAVNAGLDRFDEETTVTTSAAGLATLSIIAARIRNVQIDFGDSFRTVKKMTRSDRVLDDATVRSLVVAFVRDWRIPTTTTHPLVGVTTTPGPSWPAFDDWVCAEAARRLGIIDNDKRAGLEALCASCRAVVLGRENDNDGRELPDDADCTGGFWSNLGYIFTPSATAPTLQLVTSQGAW